MRLQVVLDERRKCHFSADLVILEGHTDWNSCVHHGDFGSVTEVS